MASALLDTHYPVETPEGIDLHAALAGPVVRILAYLMDLMLRGVLLTVFMMVFFFAGKTGTGLFLVLSFLLEWFYPVLFEVYAKGQTPGKKAMQIAVVNDDLTPIRWSPSLVRNLLRAADFFPFFYLGGLICMILGKQFQRLGDLAAGSVVIYQEQPKTALSLPDCRPRCPQLVLSLQDQVAVIAFAQRHAALSGARQQELADILSGQLPCGSDQAVAYLQGMGCWLLGDRGETTPL